MDSITNSAKVQSSDELAETLLPKPDNAVEKTKIEKKKFFRKFYPSIWVLFFPIIYGLFWHITLNVPYVLSSYYNISEQPVVTNPCNSSDSEAFQTFVALWKEKKENQTALFYKVIAEADVPEMKEKFEEEIHAAADKILAELIVPEYRTFEKCHSENNKSKRMFIAIYCSASYILLNLCFLAIYFIIDYYCKHLVGKEECDPSVEYLDKQKVSRIREGMSLVYIICPPIYLMLTINLYDILSSKVSDEFIL